MPEYRFSLSERRHQKVINAVDSVFEDDSYGVKMKHFVLKIVDRISVLTEENRRLKDDKEHLIQQNSSLIDIMALMANRKMSDDSVQTSDYDSDPSDFESIGNMPSPDGLLD